MQIERRATSLLDCSAEMLPIFYKDSNFLPKPSLFPFYPNFGPKTHKTEAQEGEKTRKTTKKCTFFEKNADFFCRFQKLS
ncbi:MAG: hypothetical protein SOY38_07625 [Sodaliphilus sp.]|nr:hypothetical protein [Bacteroidales bacterium]MDY3008740.1 hypothetical protein [Sodaliphilus sp.]MDY4076566.1 hypothetical protein [Sodaliphilus sp.]